MKQKLSLIFLLLVLITNNTTKAQGFTCDSTAYCNLNLENALFSDTEIAVIYHVNYAKPAAISGTYHDVLYDLDETEVDCNPGPSDSCTQDTSSLNFDVYYPKNTAYLYYATCKLPVLVVEHAGGYAECSSKDNTTTFSYFCKEMAKRGFVVFNIEYRRGRITYGDSTKIFPYYKTIYQELAGYRAVQDFLGAIRSVCKMQDDGVFGTKFKFDKTMLFIGGQSAGAIAALNLAYIQKQDMEDDVLFTLHEHLGSINQNFYYADTTYSLPTIRGVYCGWGDFAMPASVYNDSVKIAAFFARNNYTVPFIAFQGKKDPIIPYNYRPERFPPYNNSYGDPLHPERFYYKKNSFFDTTTFCLDYAGSGPAKLTPNGTDHDLFVIGPTVLQQLVQKKR